MSSYQFIRLQHTSADDPVELTMLKSQYNRIGTQINIQWPTLSLTQKEELYQSLQTVEEKIKNYTYEQ